VVFPTPPIVLVERKRFTASKYSTEYLNPELQVVSDGIKKLGI
jgi:hypothetical protein